MNHTYELSFGRPGESLPVHIESEKDGSRAFDATLRLSRTEISRSTLSRILVAYPPMSYRATLGIYSQAGLTWLKGAGYHGRPAAARPAGTGPQSGPAGAADPGGRSLSGKSAACPV